MARHRSPRGRHASSRPFGSSPAGRGAHRLAPTSAFTTTVTATGGMLALLAAVAPHAGAATPTAPAGTADPIDRPAAPVEAPDGQSPAPRLLAAVEPISAMPINATRSDAGPTDAVLLDTGSVAPSAAGTGAFGSSVEPVVADVDALLKAVRFGERAAEQAAAEAAERAATAEREAAERAERERVVAERRAAEKVADAERTADTAAVRGSGSGGDCGLSTSGLGAVKASVREAAEFLGCQYGQPRMIGVSTRGNASDHPSGKALDFMVDRATGDALAACALANREALGITYVIWEQKINHGNGWEAMSDRGGETANHFDHVHISFSGSAGSGQPRTC